MAKWLALSSLDHMVTGLSPIIEPKYSLTSKFSYSLDNEVRSPTYNQFYINSNMVKICPVAQEISCIYKVALLTQMLMTKHGDLAPRL